MLDVMVIVSEEEDRRVVRNFFACLQSLTLQSTSKDEEEEK